VGAVAWLSVVLVLVVLVVLIGVFVQRRRRTGGMIADVHRGRAIHPDNRVTVASDTDPYGMPVAHFDSSRSENDKANLAYSTDVIKSILHATGAQDILSIQRYPPSSEVHEWAEAQRRAASTQTAASGRFPTCSCPNASSSPLGTVPPLH
jgi:hypothetical protein